MAGLNEQVPRMTTEDIEAKISEREKARAQKNWTIADAIRDELRSSGVQVLDKEAIWRGEDDSIGVYAGPKGLPEKGIRYLLDYRETVRARKDWDHADAVRQLLRDHGVQIFDKDGTWRSDDGRNGLIKAGDFNPQATGRRDDPHQHRQQPPPPVHNNYGPSRGRDQQQPMRNNSPYRRDEPSFEQSKSDQRYDFSIGFETPHGTILVVDLLGKREQARQARDFATADDIRRVLGMCGVMIHDKTHTYSLQDGTICEIPDPRDGEPRGRNSRGGLMTSPRSRDMGLNPPPSARRDYNRQYSPRRDTRDDQHHRYGEGHGEYGRDTRPSRDYDRSRPY